MEQEERQNFLSERIRSIMQARNITPSMLATAIDVHPSNVTGFLQGKKNPTMLTLDRLALALNVPVWQLIATPDQVLADLRAAGFLPSEDKSGESAEPPVQPIIPQQSVSEEDSRHSANGLNYDLLIIDPITGQARRYKQIT